MRVNVLEEGTERIIWYKVRSLLSCVIGLNQNTYHVGEISLRRGNNREYFRSHLEPARLDGAPT
jgi:hypothetical protein